MSTRDVEGRFAWASIRVRSWAAGVFTLVPDARIDELRKLYAEQRMAVHPIEWPALFSFEERFGGLTRQVGGRLGIADWMRDPKRFSRGILRANRRLRTWDQQRDSHVRPEINGRWLGLVCHRDLDFGDFIDERGALFHHTRLSMCAYAAAEDAEHYFEKAALASEIRGVRGTATGDFFLEVDGWIGEALAQAASVPVVPEATDLVSR